MGKFYMEEKFAIVSGLHSALLKWRQMNCPDIRFSK